ncbi:MAG: hypothetical protein KC591_18100, partial [Gemmatimonadetes bacterium]|nr:hypothetical protein [Gemmatimonadota bacterium]
MTLGRPSRIGVPLLLASLLLADVARSLPASAGGTGLWDVRAATVPVAGTFGVQWAFSAYRITQDKVEGTPADRDLVDGGLQLVWSPRSSFEVFGIVNAAMSSYDGDRVFSPRDGRVGGKLRLGTWRRLETALLAHANLPFGNRTRGFSTDSFDPAVGAAVSWRLPDSNTLTAAYVHFNVGYQFHGDDRGRAFEGWPPYYLEPVYPGGDKDRLDLRAAVELRGERATLFLELLLDRIANDALAWREGPLFLTPGFRYALADEVSFTVGSKITLASDDPSTTRYRPPNEMYPDWQLTFALTWSRDGRDVDRDGDGIPDWRDGCPNEP